MVVNDIEYVIHSPHPRWAFLNGYACKAKNKDYFLRHLSYKYQALCTLDNIIIAEDWGRLLVSTRESFPIFKRVIEQPSIAHQYWSTYGYVVEINTGSVFTEDTISYTFANDGEANEWINTHI